MSTILIVDDAALAREALAKVLEYEGFTTLKARNGKEAWAMLYHERPDLVVLDLMMPEMDGVTFLTMLRRSPLWHDLPVLVLTAADDRDHLISRAWELGVSDLIPKSTFGVEDLLARVRQHAKEPADGPERRPQPQPSQPRTVETSGGRLRGLV